MRIVSIMMGGACGLLSSLVVVGPGSSAQAADLPSYFKEIVGTQTASPAEIGTKNILQLNTTMFELYGDAGQVFKKNILAQHPLILGLFSGAGGRFILYRPWDGADRRAAGSDRLSIAQIRRPQHHGVGRSGRSLSG
jgi:hypothetical protein